MLSLLPNAFGDAATNMAIDATLLETIPQDQATLRHYGWLEPAATFGYAQTHAAVLSELVSGPHAGAPAPHGAKSPHTAIVRRLTGGGIVDHRNDWTYACILHRSLPATRQPATRLYQQIHQAIRQALASPGIETHLAPCPKTCKPTNPASRIPHPASRIPHPASHCFVNPAADDVLRASDGRKIAGAAMKRTRHALLIQGSIDRAALPTDFDFESFRARLYDALAQALDLPTGQPEDLRPLFNSQRIEALKAQFADPTWNQRR